MKKKMTAFVCALAFAMVSVGVASAASVKCTVEKVEGSMVTMDCGSKAKKLEVGSKVSVKAKKKAAIEGC